MTWVFVGVALVLVTLPAVETGTRWWIRHRNHYYVFLPGWRARLYLDPETFPGFPPITNFEVNSDGERGNEAPRSARLYRVLVGGGSQPEGAFLDQAAAWPAVMQRLLSTREHLRTLGASTVHVGNIGRSGVGSEELDLIFERVLPHYPRLQLIIVLVGVSDVLHWLERGAARTFPRVQASDVFKCHPERLFGWRPNELAVVELLRRARHRWLHSIEVHRRAGAWIARARAMRARAKEIRTTMPDPAPMLDHFEFHFDRLLRRANAHADRVLVVRQPWLDKDFSPEEAAQMWHGAMGEVWREEVTIYYSLKVITRLMSLLDASAAAVCDALQVEHLDLMPILDPSLATFYDGLHLTPEGARAVAAAVSAAIVGRPLAQAVRADAEMSALLR